ncbi:AGAP002188-PA-like protein [Anopheles sinensis]|uniref:AGAP002188-PA-like protein n=1 Tax=Anopheles sinensis TaxID=74873 RepID=A0A084VVT3_ANOSI|nr:AGAP002188-PA-like protein [Anopheles sinensis]
MSSTGYRLAWLSIVVIGLQFTLNGGAQQLDPSKVSLDNGFYVLLGCARDLLVPDDLIALYQQRTFPDDSVTWCVFRCLGQRLGIYDDENGFNVDRQYERVKQRLTIDEATYKRGIRACIRREFEGRRLGDCEKAYISIQKCQGDTVNKAFKQELEEVKSFVTMLSNSMARVKQIPTTLPRIVLVALLALRGGSCALDFSKVTLDSTYYTILGCARDLYAPDDLVALYQLRIYPDEPITWCVFRCLGLRLGTYSDENGFNDALQYQRLKDSLTIDETTYRRGVRNCIQRETEGRVMGVCEKAYRILRGCQGGTIEGAHMQLLSQIRVC